MTFQCAVPAHILAILEPAKALASAGKTEAATKLPHCAKYILVSGTGAKGGYAYQFSTGPDGFICCVSTNNDPERYNVKITSLAFGLALYGIETVWKRMLELLDDLQPIPPAGSDRPVESISRFDWCIDLLMPGFVPTVDLLLTHSRTGKHAIGDVPAVYGEEVYRRRTIDSLRAGQMPGKQVAIYEKIKELLKSGKGWMLERWGMESFPEKHDIWRIEFRGGKDIVKDYDALKFHDLLACAGDIVLHMLKTFRYLQPSEDSNRARWRNAPFWDQIADEVRRSMADHCCDATRNRTKALYYEQERDKVHDRLISAMAGFSAFHGDDVSEVPTTLKRADEVISGSAGKPLGRWRRSHQTAVTKYATMIMPDKIPAVSTHEVDGLGATG